MNRIRHYVLRGREPVPCEDFVEWGRWFETADRHVARTDIGGVFVSTVFLGLDHNWAGGEPILFETMTFFDDREIEGWHELHVRRCSTWLEAETQHELTVAEVRFHLDEAARKLAQAATLELLKRG